jgi:DNA segregation ATPase FtsK/SpoIIIE, S-DNA-T family
VAEGNKKHLKKQQEKKTPTNGRPAGQKKSTTAAKKKPTQKPKAQKVREPRYEVQPEFWDNLIDALPPWFDEISAIVLLVFGVISFMSLLDVSSDATLAKAWSDAITNSFGYGGFLVSAGIFILGIIILLPKLGVIVHFAARQILAVEVAFLAILGILHLAVSDSALRAAASAGEGGGYLGWGISTPLRVLLGQSVAIVVCVLVLVISIGVAVGIGRSHVKKWLRHGIDSLEEFSSNFIPANGHNNLWQDVTNGNGEKNGANAVDLLQRQHTIMRIRIDPEKLPPSQRSNSITPPSVRSVAPALVVTDDDVKRLEQALMRSEEEAPTNRKRKRETAKIVGNLLPKKSKKAPQLVERPDGRIKRYFAIASMEEAKKLVKRNKSLPSLDILQDVKINPPDEHEINHNAVLIENTLLEFDINIDVVGVKVGPTVTQYAVQPFREVQNTDGEIVRQRTRLNKIAALSNDMALSLSAKRLRLETPVPGFSYMGIEVPNRNPSTVALRSVYESKAFYDMAQKNKSPLLMPLGRDVAGAPVIFDLAGMPHLLIAGTTGSGKSVCIAAMAMAIIMNNMPDKVKMVMLDPKMVELSRFNGLPHLLGPVETDLERIIGVLRWCTREMERRYKVLEENAARNIDTFNSKLGKRRKAERMPHMVILVDEIGDLMMTKPEETEKTITRLAQMARAVGMHLVVATQRPSVDVITGLIKANFPSRISFALPSGVDSRVILDSIGAETLLGQGDMLYLAPDAAAPRRLQGCYVTDNEVRKIVRYWKKWQEEKVDSGKAPKPVFSPWERGLTRREFLSETDPMLEEAISLVIEEQEASASQIQRKLGLGYPRAARIIDLLEDLGVIGEQVAGGRNRKVLIKKGQDPFKEIVERRAREK